MGIWNSAQLAFSFFMAFCHMNFCESNAFFICTHARARIAYRYRCIHCVGWREFSVADVDKIFTLFYSNCVSTKLKLVFINVGGCKWGIWFDWQYKRAFASMVQQIAPSYLSRLVLYAKRKTIYQAVRRLNFEYQCSNDDTLYCCGWINAWHDQSARIIYHLNILKFISYQISNKKKKLYVEEWEHEVDKHIQFVCSNEP